VAKKAEPAATGAILTSGTPNVICIAAGMDPFIDLIEGGIRQRHVIFHAAKEYVWRCSFSPTLIMPVSNVRLWLNASLTDNGENVVNKALIDMLQVLIQVGSKAKAVCWFIKWSIWHTVFNITGKK
jgi:hypothetical protein